MIKLRGKADKARLRRLALACQGLLHTKPFGSGMAGACAMLNHLGYVQIDTISVVERAHNHVFYNRVPKFVSSMTNQMLQQGHMFEYWAHAAAFLPIKDFRFSLPYKHAIKNGRTHWIKNPDKKLMKKIIERIRVDGPLRSRDLETSKVNRSGWWDWKPAKKAVEQLYMEGDLMVAQREGFQKVYDLTERVLDDSVDTSVPSTEEMATHLISQQLRCHGFSSLKNITYLRKDPALRTVVKAAVQEGVGQGLFEELELEDGNQGLIEAGALERSLPRVINRVSILSPFDHSVIQRNRLKSVFDYDYQLECYVPESKRQYGYFSLPLLFRDQFIGRMDCKAHRKQSELEIKFLHLERSADTFDQDRLVTALAKAVKKFSAFQQCDSVCLKRTSPKRYLKPIQIALN